jgi:hypothetical protein
MEEQEVTTPEGAEEAAVQEIPAEETVAEPATPEPEVAEVVIPPPVKQTAQERINEITRKRREAEREVERLQKELAEKSKATAPSPDRPKIENFETQEAYEDALFNWRDSKKQNETLAEQRQREEAEALAKYRINAEKVRSVYEDFDEVVEQPVFSPTMREVLLNSDEGPMVSYFLGRPENQAITDKIRSMPERLQVYELGKLEAKLLLAQKTKKPTGAPAPISPVGATGGHTIDESKLSDDEWFKLEKQRELEKIKKKYGG